MRHKKFRIVAGLLVAVLILSVTPLARAESLQQTPLALNIGVIGTFNGPTAEGVTLALQRFSAQGPFTTPDGTIYKPTVVTADATTAEEVTTAIKKLMNAHVVAIFGPDDDALFEASLPALQATGLPIFTSATATAIKGGGLVFRTRAADKWRMTDLADYMTTDLKGTRFAIYQGTGDASDPVPELVSALTQLGKPPSPPIAPAANGKVEDTSKALIAATPNVIIAFGTDTETAELYRTLQGDSYKGAFVTPNAANPAFIDAIPEGLRGGIYGVAGWSYGWSETDSAQFLRDYAALFGNMPTELSASAYDTAVALVIAMQKGGISPDGTQTALLKLTKVKSLQGIFNPTLGNNDLTASVSITVTNTYGAPTLVARYEDTGRVSIASVVPTPYPTTTFTPSPTPQGIVATMLTTVNVRSGPGDNYDILGQLKTGDQEPLIGASADLKWYVINFRQQQGWIAASSVKVFGDVSTLPVVPAPPTPTPSLTPIVTAIPPTAVPPQPTLASAQYADLELVSATLNPPTITSGQPFTLAVTIKNQGGADAGPFAVATSFMPGNVYSAVNLPGIPAGSQAIANLTATVTGSGTYTVDIVVDLNNQVNQGPAPKNNKTPFTYTVNP